MRSSSCGSTWAATRKAARQQQSLVTRQQLTGIGWTAGGLRRASESGQLEQLTRQVFRIGGASPSPTQRALIATFTIGPDAAISHGSAAALWDVPGFRFEPIDVTTTRDQRCGVGTGIQLHRPRFDVGPHIVELDGVPLLTPIATVWSLATSGRIHPKKLERTIDNLWARRLVTGQTLAESVSVFGKRGRRGTVLIRELSEARPPEYVAPESGLEARFIELAKKNRLGQFERQRNVGGAGWLGRVDFVNERHRIIVQIDGDRYHSALIDKRADQAQTEALEAAGWRVFRFDEWAMWQQPKLIVTKLRRVIRPL